MDYFKVVNGTKDGKPIKIFIAEIPKDRFEEAVDHMCTYFIADEPLCRCTNVKDDPPSIQEFRKLFLLALQNNVSVGAFVENPAGGKSIMAGLNVLYLGGKNQNIDFDEILRNLKSEKCRRVLQVMCDTCAGVNVEKIYGSDRYLGGFGLSVDPAYRGNAIGYHLLLARDNIGKKHGIGATFTVFTSPISAKLAARAGFTIVSEKLREELVDSDGKMLVPNCTSDSIKFMGKKLA